MGVERKNISLPHCHYAVIPIPFEKTVSYGRGTSRGPSAVLDASAQVELWDEEVKREIWEDGIFTSAAVDVKGETEAVFGRVENAAREMLKYKAVPFYVGGEHSITQPLTKPYIEKYPDLSILHFDAHADLRAEYDGTPYSHACALYPASRSVPVVQVGIRSVGSDEYQNINAGKVKTFLMHENRNIKKLIPRVLKSLTGTVYMTLDVDGFDPSVIPATGTPQPGGFGWYEALDLFRAVIENKKIVAVDVMETSVREHDNTTEMNVAKLIYRLMGYLSQKKR